MLDESMEFSESVYEECERAWSAFKRETMMENMQVEIKEIEPDGKCMFRALSEETKIDLDEIKVMAREWILKNSEEMIYPHVNNQTVESWIADEMKISVIQYADKMENTPTFWGGPPELKAVAESLDRQILVYTVTNECGTRKYNEVAEYSPTTIASNNPIRLLWSEFGGGHYELLKKKPTPDNTATEYKKVRKKHTKTKRKKKISWAMKEEGNGDKHGKKRKAMSPSQQARSAMWKARRESKMDMDQADILNQAVVTGLACSKAS